MGRPGTRSWTGHRLNRTPTSYGQIRPVLRSGWGRDESVRQGLDLSGSWQQGHSATYNARRVLKSSAKDSAHRPGGIKLRGSRPRLIRCGARPISRAHRGIRPYSGSGGAAGTGAVASLDSDLEAFSHNPAHGSFAPLAFQPSAMTNCVNQRSSRTRLNYYRGTVISRVKLTCLTTV
ncbi:hypothetical protein LUZ60_017895 [Juncus effusus]|nr:hypothetical protein LUZ60_017895 [Juncus effusus]